MGNFQQKKMYKGFISLLCLELIKINGKNKDLNNNKRTKARDTVCAKHKYNHHKHKGKGSRSFINKEKQIKNIQKGHYIPINLET